MAKKIYLSPSDQIHNAYAYGNTTEAVQCRKIAQACKTALIRCGFEAKTNTTDGSNAMYERVDESNAWGADLHICIHTNAGGGKGAEVFVATTDEKHKAAAQPIYDAVRAISPYGSNRGIKARGLYEINYANALCVYLEADFHDNAEIARWIVENTTAIGEAICKGVCKYYGVEYKAQEDKPIAYSIILHKLCIGDEGEEVKTLQRILRVRNWHDDEDELVKVDGDFGTKTEQAVKRFQKAKGLTVTGTVNKTTWNKLLK